MLLLQPTPERPPPLPSAWRAGHGRRRQVAVGPAGIAGGARPAGVQPPDRRGGPGGACSLPMRACRGLRVARCPLVLPARADAVCHHDAMAGLFHGPHAHPPALPSPSPSPHRPQALASCPQLRALDLSDCLSLTDTGLSHLAAGVPGLRALRLSGCWKVNAHGCYSGGPRLREGGEEGGR